MHTSVLDRYDAQIKIYEVLLAEKLNKGLVVKMLDYIDQMEFGAKVMRKNFAKKGHRLAKSLGKGKISPAPKAILLELESFFEKNINGI